YQESGFIKGYIEFNEGEIIDVGTGTCTKSENNEVLAKGVVLPLLTNCHTHLGDAIAYGRNIKGDIKSLVAPPNGLKFRILRESNPEELISAMRQTVLKMLATGTGAFIDFREEALSGVELLTKAVSELPINTMIMGRPKELTYSIDELNSLLPKVDGIGLSSLSDWDYSEIEKIATATKQHGRLLAMHACERKHENMDQILDLNPDFLIHMTYGTDEDYETLAELDIPVVLCPRSNIFFDNLPNIPKMLEKGITIVLGTDNAMLNTPNLFEELKMCFELANKFGEVPPEIMLKMVTQNLKKILNPKDYISLAPGTMSNFMVLDVPFSNPELTIVRDLKPENIKLINIGTIIWN
ncbi:MAG: amidohydrolase family protein, partial [Thermoplasmata archaeon]|nr:amidohydrolase family protein [Thermoplasmata archaeon]